MLIRPICTGCDIDRVVSKSSDGGSLERTRGSAGKPLRRIAYAIPGATYEGRKAIPHTNLTFERLTTSARKCEVKSQCDARTATQPSLTLKDALK